MIRCLHLGSRLYRAILLFYPEDLRRDFGDEMTEVFIEDLASAWRNRGLGGAAAVWWGAAAEVAAIAIPRKLAEPAVSARAISAALHIAVLSVALLIGAFRETMPRAIWHGVVALKPGPATSLASNRR